MSAPVKSKIKDRECEWAMKSNVEMAGCFLLV